jgi:DivIVA domain-containing protein
MDLTAESLQQVKFGARMKGYDPDEVDKFIADVAEVGEELYERVKRATERAAKAEQQLEEVKANPPAQVQAPAPEQSGASADLGRIWERAVAAAESAIDEARVEAQRILDEARRTADDAVGTAQREAQRLAEESESQLRADIARLESARDQLKGDVDGLSQYLDTEKQRLRSTIATALSALDEYGSTPSSPPATNPVDIPQQPTPSSFNSEGTAQAASEESFSDRFDGFGQSQNQSGFGDTSSQQAAPFSEPEYEPESHRDQQTGDSQSAPVADTPKQPWKQPEPEPSYGESDDDSDPFLAELRRAVRDDGPLGPRDSDDDDDSIDRLYSSNDDDDDDNSFFKRRK